MNYKGGKKIIKCKASAKRKKRQFDFLRDVFINKVLAPCHYCGEANAFGLDRLNSTIGYTEKNTVPCCTKCNYAKNTMDVVDFKKHIIKIYKHYARS
jgi:hypothetical protein